MISFAIIIIVDLILYYTWSSQEYHWNANVLEHYYNLMLQRKNQKGPNTETEIMNWVWKTNQVEQRQITWHPLSLNKTNNHVDQGKDAHSSYGLLFINLLTFRYSVNASLCHVNYLRWCHFIHSQPKIQYIYTHICILLYVFSKHTY